MTVFKVDGVDLPISAPRFFRGGGGKGMGCSPRGSCGWGPCHHCHRVSSVDQPNGCRPGSTRLLVNLLWTFHTASGARSGVEILGTFLFSFFSFRGRRLLAWCRCTIRPEVVPRAARTVTTYISTCPCCTKATYLYCAERAARIMILPLGALLIRSTNIVLPCFVCAGID